MLKFVDFFFLFFFFQTKERVWLKNQTSGELDDTKLIDGLTGESNIYKKRGVDGSDFAGLQELPKRFKVVMDVSGSMYRFNGVDSRLTKSLEAAVMVMEAFVGVDPKKFHYEICGHSGDSPYISFVSSENAPKDEKERLKVVHQISAHTQFCMSGDHTLEGTQKGQEEKRKININKSKKLRSLLDCCSYQRHCPAARRRLLCAGDQ